MEQQYLRLHAEEQFAQELEWLKEVDKKPKPSNWQLSPWAVVQYLAGADLGKGKTIETKYFGNRRLLEIAVATLATDRALLLMGIPGTAKTWLSEHLAAAISGDSKLLIQGTAGTAEESLRYSWNYARLLAQGPSKEALVESPVMRAMQEGKIVRVEELTRLPADVQDTLISILSEKTLAIPELDIEVRAKPGFNLIATANDRDRGVNDLSSALKRRFNTLVLPLPATLDAEMEIVQNRVEKMAKNMELPDQKAPEAEIKRLLTIFRELREGKTLDGKTKLKSPASTLSTAEAIAVILNGQVLAQHFGKGQLAAEDLAAGLTGAIVKDPIRDQQAWLEYLETVIRGRKQWKDLYKACKDLQ